MLCDPIKVDPSTVLFTAVNNRAIYNTFCPSTQLKDVSDVVYAYELIGTINDLNVQQPKDKGKDIHPFQPPGNSLACPPTPFVSSTSTMFLQVPHPFLSGLRFFQVFYRIVKPRTPLPHLIAHISQIQHQRQTPNQSLKIKNPLRCPRPL